jgi:hypothetical protein
MSLGEMKQAFEKRPVIVQPTFKMIFGLGSRLYTGVICSKKELCITGKTGW